MTQKWVQSNENEALHNSMTVSRNVFPEDEGKMQTRVGFSPQPWVQIESSEVDIEATGTIDFVLLFQLKIQDSSRLAVH